jgi:hypothetical protein
MEEYMTRKKLESEIRRYAVLTIVTGLLAAGQLNAAPFGTAFTYQGRLANGTNAANGVFDFRFSLWDAAGAGANLIGATQAVSAVSITNGLFTTGLDFGSGIYNGGARWLEIDVRTNAVGTYTPLSPRQNLTPSPYAVTASNLSGTVSAGQLSGTLPSSLLAGTYGSAVNFNNPANAFVGNGGGLTNLNATTLCGLGCNMFWNLLGNAGTTPGLNFLGTTDNQALELKVNGSRAFRLEPTADGPNVIGGFSGNGITPGTAGATISGGGGQLLPNIVADNFGTIGGGSSNAVQAASGTIGGGEHNVVQGEDSTIGGGEYNVVGDEDTTIGGGGFNTIASTSYYSTIAGGANNKIQSLSDSSTIGGGHFNSIQNGPGAAIAGGNGNAIGPHAAGSFIGGGSGNFASNDLSTVVGGSRNIAGGVGSFVGGGGQDGVLTANNQALGAASVIGGGVGNTAVADYSTISGGGTNNATGSFSSIGGGSANNASGAYTSISGGSANGVSAATAFCALGGGSGNFVLQGNGNTIAGGVGNSVFSDSASIGGGQYNYAHDGLFVTIGGGGTNSSGGRSSTISGGENNSVGPGTSDSSIGGGLNNNIYPGTTAGTIAGGIGNQVNSQYGTIPGGAQASTFNYGQMAYANGQFASVGDAQTSILVCRGVTTSASAVELFLDGSSQHMALAPNSTWGLDVIITGRDSAGHSAVFAFQGGVENSGGITFLMGSPKKTVVAKDGAAAAWDANFSAPGTNGIWQIVVNGAAATSIRWVARVRTVEVAY